MHRTLTAALPLLVVALVAGLPLAVHLWIAVSGSVLLPVASVAAAACVGLLATRPRPRMSPRRPV